VYIATMEESRAAEESRYFENVDATRADRPFNYPAPFRISLFLLSQSLFRFHT